LQPPAPTAAEGFRSLQPPAPPQQSAAAGFKSLQPPPPQTAAEGFETLRRAQLAGQGAREAIIQSDPQREETAAEGFRRLQSAAPQPLVARGGLYARGGRASGDSYVRYLQQQLKAQGYYQGAIDGIAGVGTHNALISFQREMGLPVTGTATAETNRALQTPGLGTRAGVPLPRLDPRDISPEAEAGPPGGPGATATGSRWLPTQEDRLGMGNLINQAQMDVANARAAARGNPYGIYPPPAAVSPDVGLRGSGSIGAGAVPTSARLAADMPPTVAAARDNTGLAAYIGTLFGPTARRQYEEQQERDPTFDRSRFNQASEPNTSDVGVPDALVEAMARRGAQTSDPSTLDTPLPQSPSPDDTAPKMPVAIIGIRGARGGGIGYAYGGLAFKGTPQMLKPPSIKSPRTPMMHIHQSRARAAPTPGALGSNPSMPFVRPGRGTLPHTGGLLSPVAGRTDHIPIDVPNGAYVLPADVISGLGQGNTIHGTRVADSVFKGHMRMMRPLTLNRAVGMDMTSSLRAGGVGGRRFDNDPTVPIMAAGGEYVIPPETVRAVGKGDMKRGHAVLDQFVKRIRSKTIQTLRKLPGPVKRADGGRIAMQVGGGLPYGGGPSYVPWQGTGQGTHPLGPLLLQSANQMENR
jgi:peptidoglycan hydrolase-like protein with peptidoglycan-binding domain